MKGEIIKIHPLKYGRDGEPFYRVEFTLEDGGWAKTDLCTNYRNWKHWQWLLKKGQQLTNLELRRPGEINADCMPDIYVAKRSGHWEQMPNGNMAWINDNAPLKREREAKLSN